MAERRQSVKIPSPFTRMSGMGVAATVRVEPDVCIPSPHGHASGYRLMGQWAISFITWEKPVPGSAAKLLEQCQRVVDEADGAGHAPLAEEANVDSCFRQFDILPPQTAELGNAVTQQIRPADHHIVTRRDS